MYKETRAQSLSDSGPVPERLEPSPPCLSLPGAKEKRGDLGESLKQWLRAGEFTQKQTQASCFPMSQRGDLRKLSPLLRAYCPELVSQSGKINLYHERIHSGGLFRNLGSPAV